MWAATVEAGTFAIVTPSLLVGGAERFAVTLHEGLESGDWAGRSRLISIWSTEKLTRFKRPQLYCRAQYEDLQHSGGAVTHRTIWRLRSVCHHFGISVLQTSTSALYYALPLLGLDKNLSIVHTIHNEARYETRLRRAAISLAGAQERVQMVFVAAHVAAEYCIKGYRRRPLIIPNGVPASRTVLPDRPSCPNARMSFVWLGSMDRPKRPDLVLEAFCAALDANANASLIYVGDGALRDVLQGRVAALNRGHQVRFVGAVADPGTYLKSADVLIHHSDSEADPLSIKEAMTVGVPVIAAAVGGIPEAVNDGIDGLLVRPGDVYGLSEAIRRMSMDPEYRHRLSRSAMSTAAARFQAKDMAAAYGSIFEQMDWEYGRHGTQPSRLNFDPPVADATGPKCPENEPPPVPSTEEDMRR